MIRETAREMARHRPATLVHPGRHVTWYGDDAQRSRAIALLNALLGSWGRKGGFFQATGMEVPGYPTRPTRSRQRGKADNPGKKYPFADRDADHRAAQRHAHRRALPDQGLVPSTPPTCCRRMPDREKTILRPSRNLDSDGGRRRGAQRDRRLGRHRAARERSTSSATTS